jgi:predicted TIM-barrel fold metal-dependent hydrolase
MDLQHIPLIDDHCHALVREQRFADIAAWQRFFTEAPGEGIARRHVRTTAFFQRMIPRLAAYLGCDATPEAVFEARQVVPPDDLIAGLFRKTNTDVLVIDEGLPSKDISLPNDDFTRVTGVRTVSLLRLELLMQDLIVRHETLAQVEDAFRTKLRDMRGQGYVGLKSIAAYRTGLAIAPPDEEALAGAFLAARREASARGTLRITHKPLVDHLLIIAFDEAARQELPVQFHTGYGDPDADMQLANPLNLRWVLQSGQFRGMRTVLLHESYPYTRQAGYLATVYDDVYLDLSYAIPFLSVGEMRQFTREAFGVAPSSKLLYASDAVWMPELYYMSAVDGRQVLGDVLEELVRDGDLQARDAEATAAAVLNGNARRLYGIDSHGKA